jgi:Protein of unknown function (DUF4236)
MGFYVRKSIKAGPFRYNLSKSGVGVSVGVPGFRVGTGPRGNYIRAGKGGVYYRATIGGSRRQPAHPPQRPSYVPTQEPIGGSVAMEDITGVSASELVPTGADDLVSQLNEAGRRMPLAWVVLLGIVVLAVAVQGVGAIVVLVLGIPLVVWLYQRDGARRSVVAFYDVEDEHARWFTELVEAFEELGKMSKAWRVNASGRVQSTYQYKVNSGASQIVKRVDAGRSLKGPKLLATNIAVPSLESGKQGLHFLPDRLLIRDGKQFSDVDYAALGSGCSSQRFIESKGKPRDGQQVDTTWQYVNVKGGPDRRFKNNRKLPVMLYGEVDLSAPGGLHWLMQFSRAPLAERLARALSAAPRTPKSSPTPLSTASGSSLG